VQHSLQCQILKCLISQTKPEHTTALERGTPLQNSLPVAFTRRAPYL
jgi:hypothetical protein